MAHAMIDLASSDPPTSSAPQVLLRRRVDAASSDAEDLAGPSARRAFPIASQQRTRSAPTASKRKVLSDSSSDSDTTSSSEDERALARKKKPLARTTSLPQARGKGKAKASEAEIAKAAAARQSEKARKQAEKAQHAEERKQWQEANKLRTSKSETSKELIVELEEGLFAEGSGPLASVREQLVSGLAADGASVQVKARAYESLTLAMRARDEDLDDLHAIRIKRKRKARLDPIRRSLVPLAQPVVEDENTVLICLAPHKLLSLVEDGALLSTLRAFRENARLLFHQIVLCVVGVEAHFRKIRNKSNRAYTEAVRQQLHGAPPPAASQQQARRRKRTEEDELTVTREQFDREMVKAKIAERCFLVQAEKPPEMVQWIISMVQDVGIRPYK